MNDLDSELTADGVRAIYLDFLGREPPVGEVEAQMASCRTTRELLQIVRMSEEYEARLRARGEAPVVERPRVNIWHPELAAWTHPPGTVSADGVGIVGRDGWLFIKSGTNSTLAQHRGEDPPSAAWLDAWMDVLAIRRREAGEVGVALACVVVPDKLAIHEEDFPELIEPVGARPVVRLIQRGSGLLYPLAELRSARAHSPVALRTDTHLTVHGNHVLATAVMNELGAPRPSPICERDMREYVSNGDLGALFTPRIVEVGRMVGTLGEAEIVSDNRESIAAVDGHVGTRCVMRNSSAADRRIAVLFGDSYGLPALHHQGLAWWLAQAFAEVHFVWVPFGWDPDYLRDVGAEVAVVQTAERFVGRVPAERVDVRALARDTLNSGQPAGLDAFCRIV